MILLIRSGILCSLYQNEKKTTLFISIGNVDKIIRSCMNVISGSLNCPARRGVKILTIKVIMFQKIDTSPNEMIRFKGTVLVLTATLSL